ncbi:MAG: guanylate kinase [Betaproteobacteria bacterium]|nr:guanylate kinase [Betaproteobacteria bacterium]
MSGILFIVSAPSGAGKTSLVRALLATDAGLRLSVSCTTRAPRPGEADGRDYHFVSAEKFERMVERSEFLETAEIYGHRYGTSHRWLSAQLAAGHDVLLEIDWQGAAQVRRLIAGTVGIFVLPPSLAELEARLVKRAQDGPEIVARRLAAAREEISHVGEFDYVIINSDFDRAAQDLASIVRAERLKLSRQLARHNEMINRMK